MDRLPFDFKGGAYTPPTHASVNFDQLPVLTQWVAPDGAHHFETGVCSLVNNKLGALPVGLHSAQFGASHVASRTRTLTAYGHDSFRDGFTTLSSSRLYIAATGFTSGGVVSSGAAVNIGVYRPPSHTGIVFTFFSEYTPPASTSVVGDFAIDTNVLRYVLGAGFDSQEFGNLSIFETNRKVYAAGFNAGGHSTHDIYKDTNYIIQLGSLQTQWGKLTIAAVPKRHITPQGIAAPTLGSPTVTHWLQRVTQMNASNGAYGTPAITYRVRYLSPRYIYSTQIGTAVLGFTPTLYAAGWPSQRLGVPAFSRGNALAPMGIASTFATGVIKVRNDRQIVTQRGANNQLVLGHQSRVYNKTQYVFVPNNLNVFTVSRVGTLHIFNRNRTIRPFGHTLSRFSNAGLVENSGRALLVTGSEFVKWGKQLVAYRIRNLYPLGIDKSFITTHHVVHNAARTIALTGINDGAFGRPSEVYSNKRFIRHHTPSRAEYGTPFVAPRVRTLTQSRSKDTMGVGALTIALRTNYIAPPGFTKTAHGFPYLIGPFKRTLRPTPIISERYGNPRVWNKTPQIYPTGFNAGYDVNYKPPVVSFRVRPVYVPGTLETRWGRSVIRDRRQTVRCIGFSTLSIPLTHDVFREGNDPPSNRLVLVSGFDAGRLGVGEHTIQGNPFPQGFMATEFGTPTVILQGIRVVEWEWPDSMWSFGTPSVSGPQYVSFDPELGVPMTQFGKPRATPHTIWARLDTPDQARLNHEEGDKFHVIDFFPTNTVTRPFWGYPTVSNQHRTLAHVNSPLPGNGACGGIIPDTHQVELKNRRILVDGKLMIRFGFPTLPHPQYVFPAGLVATGVTVDTTIGPTPFSPQYLQPHGFNSFVCQGVEVQNKNRPVYAAGAAHTQWGNNEPMVHFPRVVYPVGAELGQWGVAFVSHRVRTLSLSGFSAFQSGWSVGALDKQMTVVRKERALTTGIFDGGVGAPSVRNRYHRISPYMIAPPNCMCGMGNVVGHA